MRIKTLGQRITRTVHILEDGMLALLLASMIILASSQIFMRNFWNSGIDWIDPSLRVLVLWIGLLGAMVASRELSHINIDVISRLLPPFGRRIVATLTNLFSATVCCLVSYHSGRFVHMEYQDQTTAFSDVPAWLCELIIPVGFALMAIRFLAIAICHIFDHPLKPVTSE